MNLASLSLDQRRTLSRYVSYAQEAQRSAKKDFGKNILASVCAAQALHETGFGVHTGGTANNAFGIKPGIGWTGRKVALWTWEVIKGVPRKLRTDFKGYPTIADSFLDYARVISTRSPYREAIKTLATGSPDDMIVYGSKKLPRWEVYATEIARVYATDKSYADAIIKLVSSLDLRSWDSGK